jgi:hypothetical protein
MSTVHHDLDSAWDHYVETIQSTRRKISETKRFRDHPEHRAQAYNGLLVAEAMSYNFACLPRTQFPRVFGQSTWSPFYTIGGPSANFLYGGLYLDGMKTYRLTARMGDLKLFLMQVFNRIVGVSGFKCLGNYDCSNFELNEDGCFDVILSATRHAGNWMPLDPDSNYNFVMVRRIFGDWNDDMGDIDVRLDGEPDESDDLSESRMAQRIALATEILQYNVTLNQIWFYDHCLEKTGGKKNATYVMAGNDLLDIAGSPTSNYANGIYSIEPDEALVLELDAPETAYWEYHLYDVWLQAPDFINHQSDINQQRAVADSDGKIRVVISLSDPGVPNWLDPAGRREGIMVFRNYRAKVVPNPTCHLLKLAELRDFLPPDTSSISLQQRRDALEYRRRGLLSLYR